MNWTESWQRLILNKKTAVVSIYQVMESFSVIRDVIEGLDFTVVTLWNQSKYRDFVVMSGRR